jgi:hypothetical protein
VDPLPYKTPEIAVIHWPRVYATVVPFFALCYYITFYFCFFLSYDYFAFLPITTARLFRQILLYPLFNLIPPYPAEPISMIVLLTFINGLIWAAALVAIAHAALSVRRPRQP